MAQPTPDRAPSDGGDPGPTILVVDDDPDMRDFLRLCLRPIAGEVLEAADGEQALRIAQEATRLDLIIADVLMPGLDGTSLVRRLGSFPETAAIPVLLVSGENLPAASGPLLRKPFTARKLRAWAQALLERRIAGRGPAPPARHEPSPRPEDGPVPGRKRPDKTEGRTK